jgi:hypothetical protein
MIVTTVEADEAIAAVNIPEEIHVLVGRTSLMVLSLRRARLPDITNDTMVCHIVLVLIWSTLVLIIFAYR